MSQLAINATEWQSAAWARSKGLYTAVYDTADAMDEAIDELVNKLCQSNPEAMRQLKQVFWQGTEHWDKLLAERAEISGQLVLSDFTKKAIAKFKKK
jgi:methylglutaconyl-CoA hydratase